jgi:transposase-like protein
MKSPKNRGKKPYQEMSLLDFQNHFPDEATCWGYAAAMKWHDGFRCPSCQHDVVDEIKSRKVFECRKCHKQISVTTGTTFHKSKIPLRKWFWAIFIMATAKKGISMLYLQKQLGIKSYRAAWLMGHKIREAMKQRNDLYTLKGVVEVDEIQIGGKQRRKDRREFGSNKTPFLIAVEEQNSDKPRFVSFEELESIYEQHVLPALEKKIQKGSVLKSDGAGAYVKAGKKSYSHQRSVAIKNSEEAYQHLKWVNLLTSNLKRFLLSTYHGVNPKYRKKYLAEFAYRFNRRYWPHQAFDRLLFACLSGKNITLPELKA